jgi:hypothetical protein
MPAETNNMEISDPFYENCHPFSRPKAYFAAQNHLKFLKKKSSLMSIREANLAMISCLTDRRAPLSPWSCLFQLPRKPKQGSLITKAPNEVCSHRQACTIPIERHGHSRLASGIADVCEW